MDDVLSVFGFFFYFSVCGLYLFLMCLIPSQRRSNDGVVFFYFMHVGNIRP